MNENEVYHADKSRIGSSGLKLIAKSPAHYYAEYLDPNRVRKEQSKALFEGSAVHAAILEPDVFEEEYVVLDDSKIIQEIGGAKPRSTTKYKEWLQSKQEVIQAKKQTILDLDTFNLCLRLRDTVWRHPIASQILSEGTAEERSDWTEPETGALCKIKPDFKSSSARLIVDIKTAEDASPEKFGRSALNYGYHIQAPFYLDGARETGFDAEGFVFIVLEKTPPYAIALYYVDAETYNFGRETYLELLEVYLRCLKTGIWHGYPEEVQRLQIPSWALRKFNS